MKAFVSCSAILVFGLAFGCDANGDRNAVLFADKFQAVQKCKTQAEVEAVMSCPPGMYAATPPKWTWDDMKGSGMPTVIASNFRTFYEIINWVGDDCMIVVDVGIKDRQVRNCYLVMRKDYRPD